MLPKLFEAGFTDQQMFDSVVELYRKHPNPNDRSKPVNRPSWVADEILQAKTRTELPGDPGHNLQQTCRNSEN